MSGRVGQQIARALGVAGVLVLVLGLRVVTASRAELAEGESLRHAGQVDAAIAHYRRAARWYAPGNPYCGEALAQLATLGRDAEAAGDTDRALAAYRSIRGAILGARSFYVPHRAELEHADERIAGILGSLPPPPIDAHLSPEERTAAHLALLEAPARPRVRYGVLALIGLATWIAAAFAFVSRAVDEQGRLVARAARLWGAAWIVGFGLFLTGLALA